MAKSARNYDELKFWGGLTAFAVAASGLGYLVFHDTQVTSLQPGFGIINVSPDKKHASINTCLVPDPKHPNDVYILELNANNVTDPNGTAGALLRKVSHEQSDQGFGPMSFNTTPLQITGARLGKIISAVHSGQMAMHEGTFRNNDDDVEINCTNHVTTAQKIPDSFDDNGVIIGTDHSDFARLGSIKGPVTGATEYNSVIAGYQTAGSDLITITLEH
jgi:hypothetical protein